MMVSRIPAAVLSSLCVAVSPVMSAPETTAPLPEMVVTATRVARPLTDVLADVSMIDRATMEASGAVGVMDLLVRLPGVQLARNGGLGSSGSVYLRGAEGRFVAVYLDGVRLDSQATGGVVWEQIPLSHIERIEVVRGPAAAVYGSDAIGGVIQLFTRQGEGDFAPYAGVGVGNQGTRTAQAGVSGATESVDYSLGVSHERADGFNARPGFSLDDDGYRNTSGNMRLGWKITEGQRLEGAILASHLNSQYDQSTHDADDDRNHHQLRTAHVAWLSQWNAAYSTRVQVSQSDSEYSTTPSFYLTHTTLRNYLLQSQWQQGAHVLTAALERREDELHNPATAYTDILKRDRSQNALALGYGWSQGGHTVQANMRHDDDSEFGGQNTGSLAYGYALTPQWRITAAGATSFRAPTLYQRFSSYGQAGLKPEEGRNVEWGARWSAGGAHVGLTVFRNRVKNLIAFGVPGPCADSFGCYANVGRAEYKGVTLSGSYRLPRLSLRAALDWSNPRDLDTGRQLARRARRYATFGADTQWRGWMLGADVQVTARRYDNAANTQVLGGYALLGMYVSRVLGRNTTLTARVNNVTDRDYETAHGYATGGRTFYAGLKWAPQ